MDVLRSVTSTIAANVAQMRAFSRMHVEGRYVYVCLTDSDDYVLKLKFDRNCHTYNRLIHDPSNPISVATHIWPTHCLIQCEALPYVNLYSHWRYLKREKKPRG